MTGSTTPTASSRSRRSRFVRDSVLAHLADVQPIVARACGCNEVARIDLDGQLLVFGECGGAEGQQGQGVIAHDEERARQLGRTLTILHLDKPDGPAVVTRAREGLYDPIVLPLPPEAPADPMKGLDERTRYILSHAQSRVMLASTPTIPQEIVDQRQSAT